MSRNKRVNGDPDGKGENWPKFLSEMQVLGPVIHDRLGDVMPVNRAQARGNGRKNLEDYLNKETSRIADQQRFRDYKVNEWFDKNLRTLAPTLFSLVEKLGPRFAFIIKLLGYRLKSTDGKEKGIPFTVCTITRFGRLKIGLRMFWEDPAKGNIIHERR